MCPADTLFGVDLDQYAFQTHRRRSIFRAPQWFLKIKTILGMNRAFFGKLEKKRGIDKGFAFIERFDSKIENLSSVSGRRDRLRS